MDWQEIRQERPHQWLVVEALQAYTVANRRVVSELEVVEASASSEAAMKPYLRLHREAPELELYVVHTDREDLDIEERRWVGIHPV
jgi:hypothetical protein